jgi:hypothetical protein
MKLLACSAIAAALLLAAWGPAYARIPPQIFCWTPDHEFPIGCDEDEGDDGLNPSSAQLRQARSPSGT